MNAAQREQVLDNAKYLRQVRPLDPDEISDYVEGQPHPGAVRQVLRDAAFDLGLRERPDGTFVPASDAPMSVSLDRVRGLSARAEAILEDLLVDRFGPGWPDGESGEQLRSRIREFKSRYFAGGAVEYDAVTALGYALYHLPASYAAAAYVLAELAADGRIPGQVRVLDVGAGVGGPALAVEELLAEDGLVEYVGVEPSAAADLLTAFLAESAPNLHWRLVRETAEAFEPDGEFDLILFSNVLSELAEPAAVVGRYLESLAPEGTVVAIAPADRETAIGLREVERAVEATHGATVYAPTVRLWPGYVPESTSWSFDVRPDLEVPAFQRRLDDAAGGDGEFVNVDVQYAYSLLGRDGDRRVEFTPDVATVARMADMDAHVTERIDCVAIKLSHDLADGGNPLFLVGDGSQRVDHFAVLTERSALNDALAAAEYGDLLRFENALVLWNDDEGAYNLVVDGETVVDRAG